MTTERNEMTDENTDTIHVIFTWLACRGKAALSCTPVDIHDFPIYKWHMLNVIFFRAHCKDHGAVCLIEVGLKERSVRGQCSNVMTTPDELKTCTSPGQTRKWCKSTWIFVYKFIASSRCSSRQFRASLNHDSSFGLPYLPWIHAFSSMTLRKNHKRPTPSAVIISFPYPLAA